MDNNIVIDCHHCSTRVNARVVGAVHDSEGDAAVVLVECPSCNAPLVGATGTYLDEHNTWRYEHAERVWPAPSTVELSSSIPEQARRDIKDAQAKQIPQKYSVRADPPGDRDWKMRDFILFDPAGVLWRVAQDVE
jgi:hypothetical protein